MSTIIHKGDIGTVFELTITETTGTVVDVSTATSKSILFQKPDKTKVSKTATFTTDGSDGKIQYTAVDGDIDTIGEWSMQGYVELASGGKFHSEITTFEVNRNLSA
jgi:hypothetical protein